MRSAARRGCDRIDQRHQRRRATRRPNRRASRRRGRRLRWRRCRSAGSVADAPDTCRTGPGPGAAVRPGRARSDATAPATAAMASQVRQAKLLAHMLDHLPLRRDALQRLGHVLSELPEVVPPQQGSTARCRMHEPFARQALRQRAASRLAVLAIRSLARARRSRPSPCPRPRFQLSSASCSSS